MYCTENVGFTKRRQAIPKLCETPLVGCEASEAGSGQPKGLAVVYFFADFSSRKPGKSFAKIATPFCGYKTSPAMEIRLSFVIY